MADHYAVLGLAPYAEHSAVRAAYLELMRRYHPDINTSPEAAARAREVTAAYEVLGNPDRRIDYDLARAQAHAAIAERRSGGPFSPAAVAGLASIAVFGFLAFVLMQPEQEDRVEQAAAVSAPSRPRQQTVTGSSPPKRLTREIIKPAQPTPPPSQVEMATVPMPEKLAPPPGPAEVKRSMAAVEARPRAAVATPAVARVEPRRAAQVIASTAAKSADLIRLDRHLGMLFGQSMRSADAAKQQALYRDHYRFVGRLNACSTAACKEREYLARMGEVSATMAARPKPR